MELELCPFCDSHAESHYTHGIWVFRCVECGATSPSTGEYLPTKDAQLAHAAEAWSSRSVEDSLRAENARLRLYVRHLDECDTNNQYAVDASVKPTEYAPGPCTCGLAAKGE